MCNLRYLYNANYNLVESITLFGLNFEFRVNIRRRVLDVYDFFWRLDEGDFSNNPVVPVYERLDEGPRRVGSRIREIVKAPFLRMEIVSTITGIIPNERLDYSFDTGQMEGIHTYVFKEVGESTELIQRVELTFKGVWGILNPLLPLTYGRRASDRLLKIKEILEAPIRDSFCFD